MTIFDRDPWKKDKVIGKLFDLIISKHVVANHTEKFLLENRHIKDFYEESRVFVHLQGPPDIFIHYDCYSGFKDPMGVRVSIQSIGVYDDFLEYETARNNELYSAKNKDIPNIN